MSEIDCVCSREGGRVSRTASESGFSRQGKVKRHASNTTGNVCFRSSSALNIQHATQTRHTRRLSSSHFSEDGSASIFSYALQSCGCARSRRVKENLYNNRAVATITAYKNGSKTQCARVVGSTLNDLLEGCTVKLQLLSAARRLFNGDGSEIFCMESIIDYDNVFVSTGEPFQNPNIQARRYLEANRHASWTTNGLVWNERSRKNVTRPLKMSARMRKLLSEPKKRFLIFKNGFSTNSVEVVAHLDDIDEVIEAGTEKLKLNSKGKVLYDWSGQVVEDLSIVPVLDKCLQKWTSPVIGPMWLSCGEGFSPKGTHNFLTGLSKYVKAQLKSAVAYKHQLTMAKSEEERALVQMSSLLSMSRSELNFELETAKSHTDELKNACDRLNELINALKTSVDAEEIAGNLYKMKHIKEMDVNNGLLGDKGLRLKVYKNGSKRHCDGLTIHFNIHQARKSIDPALPDGPQLLRLLVRHCNDVANSRRGSNVMGKILFTEEGIRVDSIKELTYDQKVYLSCGEPWKSRASKVLEVQLFTVKIVSPIPPSSENKDVVENYKTMILIKDSLAPLTPLVNRGMPHWLSPSELCNARMQNMSETLGNNLAIGDCNLDEISQITDDDLIYIPDKNDISLAFHCQLGLNDKMKIPEDKCSEDWIQFKLQSWTIRKDGSIVNRLTKGSLTKTGKRIKFTRLKGDEGGNGSARQTFNGFVVVVQKNMSSVRDDQLTRPSNLAEGDNVNNKKNFGAEDDVDDIIHQWDFTLDGCICPKGQESLVLTLVDKNFYRVDCSVDDALLAVTERFRNKCEMKFQRWGIKQEDFHHLGQWRLTDVENISEWHREGMCWPIKQNGDINEDFDWPLQGYLVPFAPPTLGPSPSHNKKRNLKVFVLKNGEQCKQAARLIKVPQDKVTKYQKSEKRLVNQKNNLPSAEQLNFLQFLDHCTTKLNLPSAARRVFNESGNEMFDMTELSDSQHLYISMGEAWSNPNQSLKEKQMMRYKQKHLPLNMKQANKPGDLGVVNAQQPQQIEMVEKSCPQWLRGNGNPNHNNGGYDNGPKELIQPVTVNLEDCNVDCDDDMEIGYTCHLSESSSPVGQPEAVEPKDISALQEHLNAEIMPGVYASAGCDRTKEMDKSLNAETLATSDENECDFGGKSHRDGSIRMECPTRKVPAYLKGDKNQSLKHVYGTTMEQLLQDCTRKFKLSTPAKYLHTTDGKLVKDPRQIKKGQVLCVATDKTFLE